MQALRNEPITICGTGEQTRSFCYVSDLTDGMIKLMDAPEEITGPINLGNPGEFTMLELAQTIIKLTDSKSELVFEELPEDDPKQRQPDISLAKEKLGWEPKVDLAAGLKPTIKYFRQYV